jgi:aminopeptidase N
MGTTPFLTLLKAWPTQHRYGNGTIAEFEALAEQYAGKDLHAFFTTWLYTPAKPPTMPAWPGATV